MKKWIWVSIFLLICGITISNQCWAQPIEVAIVDGGSVITELGYDIKVNENSSLRRIWMIFNDPSCSVQLINFGITTKYSNRNYSYNATGTLQVTEPITAIEVRFILYDVFGEHIKTLSGNKVEDMKGEVESWGKWRAWESEVSGLLTVVSFVAQVRTEDGKIWRYNEEGLEEELQKVRLQIMEGLLVPKKE